jgi:hypothetical protein
MNFQDIQEVKMFIHGMNLSIEETTKGHISRGLKIPNTLTFLLKKENDYGVGVTDNPKNETERKQHIEMTSKIFRDLQGCEILCMCETTYDNGRLSIKFTDHVGDNSEEFIHYLETQTPFRVSDINSFMGQPICLN